MTDVMRDDVEEPVDFEALWGTVQQALQLYAGARWTERGEHDPGITLLQALTFNVADLSFRQSFPLVDLLTPDPKAGSSESVFNPQSRLDNGGKSLGIFAPKFSPENALTCGPVTYEDYRKAILDLVVDVNGKKRFCFRDVQIVREDAQLPSINSPDLRFHYTYMEEPPPVDKDKDLKVSDPHSTFRFAAQNGPAFLNAMVVSGGYRLWLALAPGVERTQAEPILEEFLRTNRNLCEVFSQINYLIDLVVTFNLTIEVEDDVVDFATLLAQIYQVCSTALLTPIERHSAAQRLESEASADVYLGPQLKYGWIESLAPMTENAEKFTLTLPPLQVAIEGIVGVNHVSRISASLPTNDQEYTSVIDLGRLKRPVPWVSQTSGASTLADALCKSVVLRKRGRVISTSSAQHQVELAVIALADPFAAPAEEAARQVPYGQYRKPGEYMGAASLLPAVYGTQADAGSLGNDAKQLLRFLLPLDQCLADEMDLLSKLPWLLSFDRRDPQARSRGGLWPLFETTSLSNEQVNAVLTPTEEERLKELVAVGAKAGDKELELLDYLLRFFGESRTKRVSVLQVGGIGNDDQENEFLKVQQGYLGAIPMIAYKRASIQIDKVSALQQRLAARLGVGATLFDESPDFAKLPFYVLEHRQLLPSEPSDELLGQDWKAVTRAQVVERQDNRLGYLYLVLEGGAGLKAGQLIQLRKNESRPIVANVIHRSWSLGGAVSNIGKEEPQPPESWAVDALLQSKTIVSIDLAQHDRLKWNAEGLVEDLKSNTHLWQWKSSEVWLKRVVHDLAFNSWPTTDTEIATLKVMQSFPLEWRDPGKLPKSIVLKDRRLWNIREQDAINNPLSDIELQVLGGDPLLGTLNVKLKAGGAWPPYASQLHYGWVADYTSDVFSFALSIVMPRTWLEGSYSDRYATDQWVQDVIRDSVPVHIVTYVHWLESQDFKNFSACYSQWQLAGRPAGDLSYRLLQYLSIGELPTDHRTGIGFVRVASKERSDALASALASLSGNDNRRQADQSQVIYVKGASNPDPGVMKF